jgi:DinB family protein
MVGCGGDALRCQTSSTARGDMMTIRPAFESWPTVNRRLRDAVVALTPDQLAFQPAPDRWPLWASIGHMACQRVFWLCDFAGAPGAETTSFPDAGSNCPGDEDLEHVLDAADLSHALDSTFGIIDWCLDAWSPESLAEIIEHPEWGAHNRRHPRGWALTRVWGHDMWHIGELNESLPKIGRPLVDPWD